MTLTSAPRIGSHKPRRVHGPSGRTPARDRSPSRPRRRVREEATEGLAVMMFSATASSGLAVLLMLLLRLLD